MGLNTKEKLSKEDALIFKEVLENPKGPNEYLKEAYEEYKKLKIELKDYSYDCADGCCHNYGTITKVNGEEMPYHNQDAGTILRQVLEHLGYEVEIEETDDWD